MAAEVKRLRDAQQQATAQVLRRVARGVQALMEARDGSNMFRNLAMDAVDKMPVEVTGSEERIGPFCQPVLDGGGYS